MKIKPSFIILPVLLLLVFAGACSGSSAAISKTRIATVTRGDIKTYITAVGNLVSAQEAKLTFGSSAKVKEVLVRIGDTVTANQTLAKIETTSLERSLQQAQLSYRSAQQSLEEAKEPKSSAPDPITIESREFDLETKKISLAEAQENLKNATMVAPFDGIIAEVNLVVGENIGATASAIRLIGPTKFKVSMLVNEADIHKIALGSAATVQLEAIRTLAFPGAITFISPTATIQSNVVNYKVEVQLDTGWAITSAPQTTTSTGSTQQTPSPASAVPSSAPPSTAPATGFPSFPSTPIAPSQGASSNITQGPPISASTVSPPGFPQGSRFPQQGQQSRSTTGSTQSSAGGAAIATVANNVQIREGQTVIVSIMISQANNVLVVPNRVITSRSGKNYANVLIDKEKGLTEERLIQIGITDGENTQVISGLNEDDQVLIVVASTSTVTPTGTSRPSGQQGVVPDVNRLLR